MMIMVYNIPTENRRTRVVPATCVMSTRMVTSTTTTIISAIPTEQFILSFYTEISEQINNLFFILGGAM